MRLRWHNVQKRDDYALEVVLLGSSQPFISTSYGSPQYVFISCDEVGIKQLNPFMFDSGMRTPIASYT